MRSCRRQAWLMIMWKDVSGKMSINLIDRDKFDYLSRMLNAVREYLIAQMVMNIQLHAFS
jgi:hypothetical protein